MIKTIISSYKNIDHHKELLLLHITWYTSFFQATEMENRKEVLGKVGACNEDGGW